MFPLLFLRRRKRFLLRKMLRFTGTRGSIRRNENGKFELRCGHYWRRVTGCAVARELSRYELSVCVLEKEEDVCSGTSKANSAIAHAGHDATPGSLKAKFNVQGSQMMEPLSKELDFDYVRNGSLVLCFSNDDLPALEELLERENAMGSRDWRLSPAMKSEGWSLT